jgi:hypothetical protein
MRRSALASGSHHTSPQVHRAREVETGECWCRGLESGVGKSAVSSKESCTQRRRWQPRIANHSTWDKWLGPPLKESQRPRQEGGYRSRPWLVRQRIARPDMYEFAHSAAPNCVRTACTGSGSPECRQCSWGPSQPCLTLCRTLSTTHTSSSPAQQYSMMLEW